MEAFLGREVFRQGLKVSESLSSTRLKFTAGLKPSFVLPPLDLLVQAQIQEHQAHRPVECSHRG